MAQVQVTSTLCFSSFAHNHGGQGYARGKEGSSPQGSNPQGSSPQEGHEGNEGQEVKILNLSGCSVELWHHLDLQLESAAHDIGAISGDRHC